MRKILFLDIDGVVCTEFNNRKEYYLGEDKALFEWYVMNPSCIEHLNTIVQQTGCEIVISSSWRKTFSLTELQDVFEENGFKYPEKIIGCTGVFYEWIKPGVHLPSVRGLEIKVWLDLNVRKTPTGFNNNQYNYCILDDDSDMLLEQKDSFVKTSTWCGLTSWKVEEVIKILNG